MKKMILFAAAMAALLARPLSAAPMMEGVYGELGLGPFPAPIPVFGLGYRTQMGHNGWDASVKVSTIVCATHLKGSLLYHYYFNPCLRSQFYMGAGVSGGALFARHHTMPLVSPEFVFGKQYLTKTGGLRFFQAQTSWPTVAFNTKCKHGNQDTLWMPLVVLSYGVLF